MPTITISRKHALRPNATFLPVLTQCGSGGCRRRSAPPALCRDTPLARLPGVVVFAQSHSRRPKGAYTYRPAKCGTSVCVVRRGSRIGSILCSSTAERAAAEQPDGLAAKARPVLLDKRFGLSHPVAHVDRAPGDDRVIDIHQGALCASRTSTLCPAQRSSSPIASAISRVLPCLLPTAIKMFMVFAFLPGRPTIPQRLPCDNPPAAGRSA